MAIVGSIKDLPKVGDTVSDVRFTDFDDVVTVTFESGASVVTHIKELKDESFRLDYIKTQPSVFRSKDENGAWIV